MRDLSLLGGIGRMDLGMVVLRRRRSGWGLAVVLRSLGDSRRIVMEVVHCMRHMLGGHRMPVVLPVSSKLQGATRSHGDP